MEGNVLGQLELAVPCPGGMRSVFDPEGPLHCGLYYLNEALMDMLSLAALSPTKAQNSRQDSGAGFIF